MSAEETVGIITFLLLLGAALTSLTHVVKGSKEGKKVIDDFTIVISIFIVGWLSTEMLAALSRGSLKMLADVLHLLILLALAVVMTLRWRWAVKEAQEWQTKR